MDIQIDKTFEDLEKAYAKLKNKSGILPPDKSKIEPRIEDEFLYRILKNKLKENIHRNRGYLLDGFPRCYKDAREVFMDKKEGEDITEEDKNPEEKMTINKEILPNNVILLGEADDEELFNRIKLLPEEEISGTHYNEEGMKRRLASYRKTNESTKGDPSLIQFYKKQNVSNLNVNCNSTQVNLVNKMKIFFEKDTNINNYMKFSEENEIKHKIIFDNKLEKKNADYLIDLTE